MSEKLEESKEVIKKEEISKEEVLEIVEDIKEVKEKEEKQEIKEEIVEKKENVKNTDLEKSLKKIEKDFEPKKNRKIKLFIILSLIVIVLIAFSTVFALLNINNTNIMNGITINGINVSGLSTQEAIEKVKSITNETLNKNMILKTGDYEENLLPTDIDTTYNIEKAIESAHSIGRKGNIITNNYSILSTFILKRDIPLEIKIDNDKLDERMNTLGLNIPDAVVQSSYHIDGESLIISRGTSGNVVIKEELKNRILNMLNTELNSKEQIIEIPIKKAEPDEINLEKIHEEIYKEPQNAYFVKEPFQLFTHVDGVDFGISMDEAKNLLVEDKQEYIIPLKITSPEITTKQLGMEAFPEKLATYTTRFDASNTNRATNIRIAANTINGMVLMPGESMSFNGTLGPRTAAKGYKPAGAYLDGQVIDSYGGGICQVSSTLYNTVLLANLEIVTRYNHSSLVSYLPVGRDAAVSYGGKDFEFKNSRSYPIKIAASAKNGVLKIEFYGIKEETEYEIIIESRVTQSIPYTIKYVDNAALPAGTEKVKSKGTNGAKSVAYKVTKLNGVVISRVELSRDTYNPMQRIVERGTGAVATPVDITQQVVDEPVQ